MCLSVRDHIFGTTRPIFTNFVHVKHGRGSVMQWLRSDMLSISGFMDDVIFVIGCDARGPSMSRPVFLIVRPVTGVARPHIKPAITRVETRRCRTVVPTTN